MRTDDPPSDPPPDPALIEADVYRCFFERSAGASCLFDLETRRVLQANPAFGALYGYNQDAIAGLTFDDLQTDPHDTGVLLARVVAEGSLTLPYGRQRRRDGRPFPVGLRLFPFAVAGRVVIGQISWDRSGLQHLENTLEAIIAATSPVIGDDYCRSLVRTLAQVLEVDFAAICLLEPGTGDEDDCLRSLAVWGDGAVSDEVCYPRVGSLCAEALRHGVCLIPDRAAERFPGGALLQTLGIQAYVGLRLQDGAGNPLGVLMTMHRSPMIEGSMIAQVLQVVAGRLSAEIGRQQSEQALRRSEADLAAILDSETDSTWSVDRAYRLIVGNARFAEAYQQVYGHLPLPGADLIPLQGPEVALPWQALFDRALAGESFMFSYVSDRSGAPRHHEIAFSPIRSDGVITSLRGQSRDVTDRVTAEIAQQRSEQNLRSVIESSPEPIWSIDTAFRLTAFNVSFSDGYAAVMGRPPVLGDVVLDDSAVGPVYRAGYERALAGENVLFEQAMVYGGLTITLELTFNPIRSGSGVRGVWAFSKDITARKQTEAALLREKEVAEAATRAKAEFLAIMSHEIRTPLHAVLGLAGLLLDTPLSAEQRDYAETLEGSAATLSTILNDILDYSKLEVGKLTVHAEPFDVEALVADVAEMMAMRADEKGLDVVLHLDPGLPSRLIADSSRIKQVLLNLLSNAIKFTDAGSVMLDVRGAWLDGGICRVTFAVRDTGIGIPPHKQGLLFQKFTQADSSTTRRFGGTGLGLAISQELVELMGGELAMTSQEGIGSIFVFTLTLVTAGSPAEVRAQPPVLAGHTVLMLSANPWRVESFAGYFQLWGLAHHAAATLDEALDRLARGGTPGIILVDWAFYERYGGEVLARLAMVADLSVSLPLLLVPLRRRHARQADARAFAGSVAFPIRPALLRQHLLTMLGLTPAAPATLATPVRMAAGAPPPLRHPYRVLVVDDNAVNLKVACRMLERLGCMVDMVMTGQEAIDRVPVARYDLIFMDCQMPELDGYQTTRAIRALAAGGRVPIVAITAYALPGDRAKCLAAGMNDYLSKPIQREGLHMMLERWARVPRAVGTAAVPVIDRERLRDLVDDDEELLADIVTAYLEAVPGWCAELSRHAAAADLPLLGRAVHKVKGTLLNVAATTATAVARDLEEAARAGDADQANALLPVLQAQLLEVGTALAALTIAAVV